jgi:hypothetical protein
VILGNSTTWRTWSSKTRWPICTWMDMVLMLFLVSMSIHNLEVVLILLVVNLEVDQVVLVVKDH